MGWTDPTDLVLRLRAASINAEAKDDFVEMAAAVEAGWATPRHVASLFGKNIAGLTDDQVPADPAAVETMLALFRVAQADDETKGMNFDGATPEQGAILRRTVRLQERWEASLLRYFDRLLERRFTVMRAKARSTQFRRGTPLWDPPGNVPVSTRADTLIDLVAWNAEITADIEPMLRDLFAEAVEALEISEAKAWERPLSAALVSALEDFVRTWLAPILAWNDVVARIVRDILTSEPTTDEAMTAAINEAGRQAKVSYTRTAIAIATGGVNQAQMKAASEAGATFKVWYSARDNRVRTGHRLANGQRARLPQPFVIKDSDGTEHLLDYPGDTRAPPGTWIGCRCVCLWVGSESGFWDRSDDLDPFGRLKSWPNGPDTKDFGYPPGDDERRAQWEAIGRKGIHLDADEIEDGLPDIARLVKYDPTAAAEVVAIAYGSMAVGDTEEIDAQWPGLLPVLRREAILRHLPIDQGPVASPSRLHPPSW